MTVTARECPFCGSVDLVTQDAPGLIDWVRMVCKNCYARSTSLPKSYPGVERGLIMKWNRRAYRDKHD